MAGLLHEKVCVCRSGRTRWFLATSAVRLLFLLILAGSVGGPFILLGIWSIAKEWFWPAILPQHLTLEWFDWAANVPGILRSLRMSILVAVLTTCSSTAIALPAAFVLNRAKFPGSGVIKALLALPLMVPYMAMGIGIVQLYRSIHFLDTLHGVVLAHTIAALPFSILVFSAAFKQLPRDLEEAAHACGASRFRVMRSITVPMLHPAILAQAIYVFTLSMDEFVLTLLVSGPHTITLPIQIYSSIGNGFIQLTSALAVLLLLPSIVLIYVMVRKFSPQTVSAVGG